MERKKANLVEIHKLPGPSKKGVKIWLWKKTDRNHYGKSADGRNCIRTRATTSCLLKFELNKWPMMTAWLIS